MNNGSVQALNESNYTQILKKVHVNDSNELYGISSHLYCLSVDCGGIDDPLLYVHEGDLHISSLTTGAKGGIAKFNMYVEGNLYVDGDISLFSEDDMGFVVVNGDVRARNVILSGCSELKVAGELTVDNTILGHDGHGALTVDGVVNTPLVINLAGYSVYFRDNVNAVVLSEFIYTTGVDPDFEEDAAGSVLLKEYVGRDGCADIPKIKKAILAGKNVMQDGVAITHKRVEDYIEEADADEAYAEVVPQGSAFIQEGNYKEGYLSFKRALAMFEDDADDEDEDIMFCLYSAVYSLGHYIDEIEGDERAAAVQEYIGYATRLIDMLPNRSNIFVYTEQGKFELEMYRSAGNGLAWYRMELGELEQALSDISYAENAISTEDDYYIYDTKARILLKMGKKEEAFHIVKKTMHLSPDFEYFEDILNSPDYLAWNAQWQEDELTAAQESGIKGIMDACNSYLESFEAYRRYQFTEPATDAQIEELSPYIGISLPQDLIEFYKTYGGIQSTNGDSNEYYGVEIFSPSAMLSNLKDPSDWGNEDSISMGLIDMIVFCWGGERYEFYEYVDDDEREKINDTFKCIGWYTLSWSYEEYHLIYFDRSGKFGSFRYHQDEFDELMDQIEDALGGNGPTMNFEEIMCDMFKKMKEQVNS